MIRHLVRSGHQAYLVGGCVRDLLLGRTPKDFDVATDATRASCASCFRNCRIIGRRFRLAHIILGPRSSKRRPFAPILAKTKTASRRPTNCTSTATTSLAPPSKTPADATLR